jgi:hypothetical protein
MLNATDEEGRWLPVIFLETSVQTPLGNVVFTPEHCVTQPEAVGLPARVPLISRWVTGDDGRLVARWVPEELLIDPCRQVVSIIRPGIAAAA